MFFLLNFLGDKTPDSELSSVGRPPVTVWAGQKGDHLEEMDKRNTVARLITKQARSAFLHRPQDLKCTCPKGMMCGGQELVKPSARPRSLFKDNR